LIVEHARYVADRIGVDHVALGSDFDGATMPSAIGDVSGLPRLLEAFAAAGFTGAEIDSIAWRNWRRVLADWWSGGWSASPSGSASSALIRARNSAPSAP